MAHHTADQSLDITTAPTAEDLAVLEPARSNRLVWAAGALGLVLAAVIGGRALLTSDEVAYETAELSAGQLVQRVTAVGQLEPVESVEIGSELTGKISEVLVDVNDEVTAGQVLARVDPEAFENAVTQAKAVASSARANLKKAEVERDRATSSLSRNERLFAAGASTQVDLEEAQLTLAAAGASVDAARASLSQSTASLARAEQDLSKTVITSPIDGVVISRLVDKGQTVVSSMSATALFQVASDLGALKVDVAVDEADVGLVRAGQRATFTVSAFPDRVFEASVLSVDLAADASATVVVYGTELLVDNSDRTLRSGMTATAEVQVDTIDDALLVPTMAIRYRPDRREAQSGDHIWTLTDGSLVAVPVRIGGTDGTVTAIYGDALSPGMVVVVGGGS